MATVSAQGLTCILQAFERNRYFYGKLMTVRDFEEEQRYLNGKRWLINRLLLGSGTVCGLDVVRVGDPTNPDPRKIRITPGVAIDPCGREIVVPEEKEYDLADLKDANGNPIPNNTTAVRICLAYHECQREPVPALKASTCEEACDYSRIRETYQVQWHPAAETSPEASLSLCERWLNRKTVAAQTAQVRVERTTPLWVRANEIFEVAVKVMALQDLSNIRLTETIAGGSLIEPPPTPPGQFPTPPVDLEAGELFLYVYEAQAGAGPGPVTIALGSLGVISPAIPPSSLEIVADLEAKLREESADRWLLGCGSVPGDLCVDLAEIPVGFTGNTLRITGDPDNVKPRRLNNLKHLADLLECVRMNLRTAPGSPRPGHLFITFKDLETADPQPVGPNADPGDAYTVSRGNHAHALPLAPNSGLEFAPGQQIRINGPVGGEGIDFLHTVRGQNPIEPRHLVTKQYVDSKVAGLDWQESVLDKDRTTPPSSPSSGERYLLHSDAVAGAWSGHAGSIATWNGADWVFTPPNEGMAVFVEDENRAYIFVDGVWLEFLAMPQVTAGDGLWADGAVLSVGPGAGIVVNPDDLSVAFEPNPPRPVGPTANPGTANTASRGDHIHALPEDFIMTGITTGVVIFILEPDQSRQEAVSGAINPRLGSGPICVLLGLEQGQNEPIFIGSTEDFQGPRFSQVQLGAEVRPTGVPSPEDSTFRVWVRAFPSAEILPERVRVRWWAFKPGKDQGEVIVSPPRPTPTLTFPTVITPTLTATIITPTLTSPTVITPTLTATIITPRPTPTLTFPTVITPTLTATIITPTLTAPTATFPTLTATIITPTSIPTRPATVVIPTLTTLETIAGPDLPLGAGGIVPPSVIVPPRATGEARPGEISLRAVEGMSSEFAERLMAAGIQDAEALSRATPGDVASILGLARQDEAKALIEGARRLL